MAEIRGESELDGRQREQRHNVDRPRLAALLGDGAEARDEHLVVAALRMVVSRSRGGETGDIRAVGTSPTRFIDGGADGT